MAMAQLKGKVINENTQQPVAGAAIFLSNTSVGTVADAEGMFTLNIPNGRFDLVVSCIGYETQVSTIYADKLPALLTIKLKVKVEDLGEVVVGAYEKDGWKQWGEFFINTFIGTSSLALDCKLKNPAAIKFRYSKRLLQAFASEPLEVENNAMGYHIQYQLTRFEFDFTTNAFIYEGYPLFIEMAAKNERQLQKWKSRREAAYYGSVMHFMRCLFRNTLIENGYEVRKLEKISDVEKKRVAKLFDARMKKYLDSSKRISADMFEKDDSLKYYKKVIRDPESLNKLYPQVLPGDSIAYAIDSATAGLAFDDYLHVTYRRRRESFGYEEYKAGKTDTSGTVMSQLYLPAKRGIAVLANGSYFEGVDLMTIGFWAWWEKLGDMLPYDYWPAKTKQQ